MITKNCIVDVDKGPDLSKLVFVWQKKPFNSVQKLFMSETVLKGNYKIIFTTARSSLPLSSKIKLFATVVKDFQLQLLVTKSSMLDVKTLNMLKLKLLNMLKSRLCFK